MRTTLKLVADANEASRNKCSEGRIKRPQRRNEYEATTQTRNKETDGKLGDRGETRDAIKEGQGSPKLRSWGGSDILRATEKIGRTSSITDTEGV